MQTKSFEPFLRIVLPALLAAAPACFKTPAGPGFDAPPSTIDASVDAASTDASIDTTPPTIISKSPDDGASNVGLSTTVSVMFSEAVDPASITSATLVLNKVGGSSVAGKIQVTGATALLSPTGMLDPNAQYQVKVTTGVTDAAGNHLAAQATWMFQTGTASWTTQSPLENDLNRGAQSPPSVAIKGGKGVAVWPMSVCGGNSCQITSEMWAAPYSSGTWTVPTAAFATGTNVSVSLTGPFVDVDTTGKATAVWSAKGATYSQIMSSQYVPGTGWSSPVRIDSENLGNATSATVAIDAAGAAYAVWTQNDATTTNVWANRFVPGTGWGTAKKLNTATQTCAYAAVSAGAAGFAVAAWQQNGSTMASVFNGTTWSNPANIGAGSAQPNVLVLPDGSALVVWTSTTHVYANRYTGAWGNAQTLDTQGTTVLSATALASPSDSKAIALWTENGDLYQARFNPSSGWGSQSHIEAAAGTSNDPDIRFSTSGRALAGWNQPGAASASPWGNVFDPTNGWGVPQLISQDANTVVSTHSPKIYYDDVRNVFGAIWVGSAGVGFPKVYYAELH